MNLTNTPADIDKLRRRAEARLPGRRKKQQSQSKASNSEAATQRLLHELQIHQIELELQNEELQQARDKVELLLEKYADLYDFAPVGYFSLDEQGRILESNLTGAALLGVERSILINRRLQSFVIPSFQRAFLDFLKKVFAESGKQICEAMLVKDDGAALWVNFHASPVLTLSNAGKCCRLAISDITALKGAEETQRRMEALNITNQELRKEIIRRQAAEIALKDVDQRQRQLLEQSHQMQAHLRRLSHKIIQAQEEERKRISRELHDDISQTLVGIHVQLESLAREDVVNPKGLRKKISQTQQLVENAVSIVHRFAQELRPPLLDDLGLIASAHSFMKDFMKRTGIRVQFTAFAKVELLNNARRTALYRVIQSALANIAQHAQASAV